MAQQAGLAEAVWRERLARFVSSGLSVKAFCEREGVSCSNFHAWRQRLKASDGSSSPPTPDRSVNTSLFVPVALSGLPFPPGTEMRIELPGGAVVHVPLGAEARVLSAVIEAAVKACEGERSC